MGAYFIKGDVIQLRPLVKTACRGAQTTARAAPGEAFGSPPADHPTRVSLPGGGRGFWTRKQLILAVAWVAASWVIVGALAASVMRMVGR